jgi:uncharacterized protein (TIGR01777 family)
METVLITGGSGLVGSHLSWKLAEKGYSVKILTRKKKSGTSLSYYSWNPERNEIESEALIPADYIIHLAGENIGEKRWTKRRKRELEDSRIKTAELILEKIKENRKKPKAFISASGTGYYGAVTTDKVFYENDNNSEDFTGQLCRRWENAADRFDELGIRTIKLRTGVVLARKGGALGRIALPTRLGFALAIGSGKQYMPWIHIDDLCGIYLKIIDDQAISGIFNAVAPEQCTNREFVMTVAKVLNKPFCKLNIPSTLMKTIYGEMADILLEGSRVSPDKIIKAGYVFHFPVLETALIDLYCFR